MSVKAPKQFPKDLLGKFVYRDRNLNLYKRGISIIKTNEKFKEAGYLETYLAAFHILSATPSDDDDTFNTYDPLEENLRDSQKISVFYKYISTELNS